MFHYTRMEMTFFTEKDELRIAYKNDSVKNIDTFIYKSVYTIDCKLSFVNNGSNSK